VLYQSPELILADEPVSAMDPVLADHTLSLLNEETSRRGITLPPVCMRWTWPQVHRIIGGRAGQVMFDLAPKQ
jgi:phosphonate transport system ATP-binding protein